jgi:hypothetical protein
LGDFISKIASYFHGGVIWIVAKSRFTSTQKNFALRKRQIWHGIKIDVSLLLGILSRSQLREQLVGSIAFSLKFDLNLLFFRSRFAEALRWAPVRLAISSVIVDSHTCNGSA